MFANDVTSPRIAIVAAFLFGSGTARPAVAVPQDASSLRASQSQSPHVTGVEGPSNFHRLSLPIESSAMGRTGLLGPPPGSRAASSPEPSYSESIVGSATLTGADLYRLSCRSCHREDGSGAPPEINGLLGPVQATSAALMEHRMKERGRPITAAFARELAAGSMKDLIHRLKVGGQKMPSFAYLSDREAEALIGYLNQLAGLPVARREQTVTESAARVGELLVKGTCHICHDATGRWPTPEELLQGVVPPIARFTAERTMPEIVRKVRHGAPVEMGLVPFPYRGRMPVFDYLRDEEVVSAYLYLMTYPPRNASTLPAPPN